MKPILSATLFLFVAGMAVRAQEPTALQAKLEEQVKQLQQTVKSLEAEVDRLQGRIAELEKEKRALPNFPTPQKPFQFEFRNPPMPKPPLLVPNPRLKPQPGPPPEFNLPNGGRFYRLQPASGTLQ